MPAATSSPRKDPEVTTDYVRMFYEHQYDRIAKLETQSQNITNIVITITIGALTFGFSNIQSMTSITGLALPAAMVITNLFAIVYVLRTNGFTRVHTARAKRVLELYAPELYQLDKALPFTYIRFWGLEKIVFYIHLLLILVSLIPVFIFLRI